MSDISKIQPGDGNTYDVKDAIARTKLLEISPTNQTQLRNILENSVENGSTLVKLKTNVAPIMIQSNDGVTGFGNNVGFVAGTIFDVLKISSTEYYVKIALLPSSPPSGYMIPTMLKQGITFFRATNSYAVLQCASTSDGYIPYEFGSQFMSGIAEQIGDQESLNDFLNNARKIKICSSDGGIDIEVVEGNFTIPSDATGLGVRGETDDGCCWILFMALDGHMYRYWDVDPNNDHEYHYAQLI